MRLCGHRAADYVTMAESVALAVTIECGLRFMSVSSLLALLERVQPGACSRSAGPSHSLDRFAAAAYRLLPIRATCLRESLVLYGLLRRHGAAPRLCVGVRKDGVTMTAHAWVECDGVATSGEERSFLELTSTS